MSAPSGRVKRSTPTRCRRKARVPAANGDALALVGLVNLHLDPDLNWPVRPYLGGGIGAAYVALDTGDDAPLEVNTGDVDDVTSHEVLVGLRYTF